MASSSCSSSSPDGGRHERVERKQAPGVHGPAAGLPGAGRLQRFGVVQPSRGAAGQPGDGRIARLGEQGQQEPVGGQEGLGSADLRERLPAGDRSEEHTSELQSLMRISYAVFCLKKKKAKNNNRNKENIKTLDTINQKMKKK